MGQAPRDFIKTKEEIDLMRQSGHILASILNQIKAQIRPDVDIWSLEELFISLCKQNKVKPSCKGYDPWGYAPFPTGLCVSINNQCVHGFPKKGVNLIKGDIVTIDTSISYKGYNSDSSFAVGVGKISEEDRKFLEIVEKANKAAIEQVVDNVRIGKISNTMQKIVEKAGFNVIKDYAGHGIGREMHEWPQILCYGDKNFGAKLRSGMTVCVETLACQGKDKVENIGIWETKMKDGKKFCQFEHTVLVKDSGYEILTLAK